MGQHRHEHGCNDGQSEQRAGQSQVGVSVGRRQRRRLLPVLLDTVAQRPIRLNGLVPTGSGYDFNI